MDRFIASAVIATLLVTASAVEAQRWDTPSFMAPQPGSDLGVYLVEGGDLGIHGLWRRAGSANLGVRVGYLDTGDGTLQLGAETWGAVILEGADFPLDLSWTAGAGASVNGGFSVSLPVGLSIGRTFRGSSVSIQAYGHPRLALVLFDNPATNDLELDLDGQFDLGADVFLSESWTLRVGASLGGSDALGIGLAWRE